MGESEERRVQQEEAAHEEGPTRAVDVKSLALERSSLILAAFGFALLVIKVTRVSHLNPRTSHGLIENAGPISVVLGALVGHFPVILFITSALALWWAVGSVAALRTFTVAHAGVSAVLVLAVLLLPWPFVIGLAIVVGIRGIQMRFVPFRTGRRSWQYSALIGCLAILILTDSDVWYPAELFKTKEGNEFVGYTLVEPEVSTGWFAILTEEEREIVRIRLGDIVDREACRHRHAEDEFQNLPSLLQLVLGEDSALPESICPGGD